MSSLAGNANLAEVMTVVGIYTHAWFLVFAVGLPYVVLAFEFYAIWHKDSLFLGAARRASVVWGISFAAGAATGTLVEFGLVQIWSGTLAAIGTFFFSVMYIELFAFMTEIVFVVLYIYTWEKMAYRWLHWLFGFVVLIGSNLSAFLILGANAFMNVPWGTGPLISKILPWEKVSYGPLAVNETSLLALASALSKGSSSLAQLSLSSLGQILYNPFIAFYDPDLYATFAHTVAACVIIVAFEVSAALAYLYMKSPADRRQQLMRLFRVSFGIAAVTSVLQPVFGDFAGRVEYVYQYTKFLAAEGFGANGGTNPILGILLKGNSSYYFPGFNQLMATVSKSISPSSAIATIQGAESAEGIVFPLYYGMVGAGVVLFVIALVYFASFSSSLKGLLTRILRIVRTDVDTFLLYSSFAGAALGLFAGAAGWAVREVGRHPWTIYGLVPYYDVVTPATITPAFVAYVVALELAVLVGGTYALAVVVRHELRDVLEVR